MSKRRTIKDRIWVSRGAGFGASKGIWGVIIDWPSNSQASQHDDPCLLQCGDSDCREWADVELESGNMAYHVSECQMFDVPQQKTPP